VTDEAATVDLPYGPLLILRARCCRDWPVLGATPMGHCGYCGQVPVLTGEVWK
jgi:hypothetical protein